MTFYLNILMLIDEGIPEYSCNGWFKIELFAASIS